MDEYELTDAIERIGREMELPAVGEGDRDERLEHHANMRRIYVDIKTGSVTGGRNGNSS
jgi:hypothetical protein